VDTPTQHPAVVLTLSATGLAVARSLAPRGVAVYGSDPSPTEIGHFSRWVRKDPRIARVATGQELLEGLVSLARECANPPVLYAAGDASIEFVSRHGEALREHFRMPRSLARDAARWVDKRSFYARCLELGVDLPRTYYPESESEARSAANTLRYPAIVKPCRGHRFRRALHGQKLAEAQTPDEALRWWQRFRSWGGETVLQEVVPGPERNIFVAGLYVDAEGECRSLFTARKARQYPPRYGSGSYMEACWAEEIAQLSRALVRGLGFTGICGTEYKWDPRDERWKLIELNPRPTLWFSLPRAAGVDVVWDAHQDLCGRPAAPHIGVQRDGVRWQLLARDVLAAGHFWRRGELSTLELLRTCVDPRGKDYGDLSLADPGTILGTGVEAIAKYFSHVRGDAEGAEDGAAR
jgi:predicted ATP-grasp superfamily ATP-dependent carboligase